MHLQVPITIADELDEQIVDSTGFLDLASGEIHEVTYANYDVQAKGIPATLPDYAFTSGKLSHAGKDVEFSVQVDLFSGRYSVTANELLDIKVRAAKLFAGIQGKDLARAGGQSATSRRDIH
ncbi:hypothetical protein [Piscinibacter sp. XHJ-5]|uniref:hypothetical protein n=1 Tax=Piscinibacter sp. XHJ-5 TaxID=3037797 RepID=UPI002452EF2E|nr:hypothetical protein [Piscinibacter sp. XHJ-5]